MNEWGTQLITALMLLRSGQLTLHEFKILLLTDMGMSIHVVDYIIERLKPNA
jgi:hypothetical protein